MINFIDDILNVFKPCFSRTAAFRWFVVIVTAFLLRSDKLGVTSVIRDLALRPDTYESLLHFFRASSWSLDSLCRYWMTAVLRFAPLHQEYNCTILIGDGVKQAKEARFMPGVKKLFQESENSSKPDFFFGHMFGGLGVLAGDLSKWFCIPLSIRLHDGLEPLESWLEPSANTASHVVRMIRDAYDAAKVLGNSLLLLDRYFLSIPALSEANHLNQTGQTHLDILTKAKLNCKAYEAAPKKKPGRGRPPKKGKTVYLKGLFDSCQPLFQEGTLILYGKKEQVRYYCVNLLWGQKLYQELRFVLVEYGGTKSILASTNLSMEPLDMIRLYSYRFRIECTFRELKQQIGGFCYHFWSKSMPKLNRYLKKGMTHPLESITQAHAREKIIAAVSAIECHMMLSVIAMGILQMLSLRYGSFLNVSEFRYMRTPSKKTVSEATMMQYLRQHIFRFMAENPHLGITQIILEKQKRSEIHKDLRIS